jgi:hypothetical protein
METFSLNNETFPGNPVKQEQQKVCNFVTAKQKPDHDTGIRSNRTGQWLLVFTSAYLQPLSVSERSRLYDIEVPAVTTNTAGIFFIPFFFFNSNSRLCLKDRLS